MNMAGRPTTMAPHGMVVTPHYLASQVALGILREGGNAVEAAIAAASTIGVVYPHMNSIGGDNFWLIFDAETGRVNALNASGRSGEKATIQYYRSCGYSKIPARGYLAANTVPGVISGWEQAYNYSKQHMGGKLLWSKLLSDAIDYAGNGFPVTPSQEYWTRINLDHNDTEFRALQRYRGFRQIYLKQDGSIYQAGERFKQEDLAYSLQVIAEQGATAFYTGEIAKKITTELHAKGGLLTLADFANHSADWVLPLSVSYRDCLAYNLPPNTQGMASLSILNILQHIDLKAVGEGTPDYYHIIVEATKQAFADRDRWLTDPEFLDIPVSYLLSQEHGAELADRIDRQRVTTELRPLDPKGDTVWIGVVDRQGHAVSLIQSIYHDFGSGIIPEGTGVILQNRGSFFSLDARNVNCLAPRKRTSHTLNPAMLLKNNKPYLVYGTMGGEGQPQTQAAIVTRIIDFGFTVQQAIEAPRWLYGRTWGAASNDLKVESRIAPAILNQLAAWGHIPTQVDDYTDIMGHAGAILIDSQSGIKYGGADPRGDGAAVGY